jgi:hypothetical protein
MNWYLRHKIAQISGEYWITDSGQAMGADGDVGDQNHASYVMQSILSSYDMDFENDGVDINDPSFLEQFVTDNFEESIDTLVQQGRLDPNMVEALLEDPVEGHEEIVSRITIDEVLGIKGASPDEIAAINGSMDPRDYAMKIWGWKRLEGRHVETWTLTPGDMGTIAEGLFDAYQEDVEGAEFTVHVHSTGKIVSMMYEQFSQAEKGQRAVEDMHGDAAKNYVNELDKPSNPFYKDWN